MESKAHLVYKDHWDLLEQQDFQVNEVPRDQQVWLECPEQWEVPDQPAAPEHQVTPVWLDLPEQWEQVGHREQRDSPDWQVWQDR